MNKRGITFIELITVIAIMSIIFLIVVPKTNIALNFKERKDFKELKRDIIYARNMSIVDVKRYSLDIYPKEGYYYINRHDNKKKISRIKKKVFESNLKMISVNFTGSNSSEFGQLIFSITGAPSMGGNIQLKNSKGQNIKLTIEVATGKVNIYIDGEKQDE